MKTKSWIRCAVLAAAMVSASVASAATLLDYGDSLEATLSKEKDSVFDFEFGGGSITFALKDAFPNDATSNITLKTFANNSWTPIFTDVVLHEGQGGYTASNLLSGLYRLSLGSLKGDFGNAQMDIFGISDSSVIPDVSPVPLPGAALLFASSLLGAGALRRRKGKQEKSTAGALPA